MNDMGTNPISFHIPKFPNIPKGAINPATEPVTEPVKSPVTSPITEPILQPFPFPDSIPTPIPLPDRKPNNQNPTPIPQPVFPTWATDPNYDWEKHWKDIGIPITETKKNVFQQSIENILTPIVTLLALNQIKNEYIKVNVTDPIYNEMLKDPILGNVLREAEKANMDAETVGTILANFDWENGDYADLEKSLITGIGAVGAARLLIFIIGRKVAFRL